MHKVVVVNRRRILLGAASALFGRGALRAQQTQRTASPTFSAEARVVNVFVTVRDKKGGIVKDLVKEDFALREEGRAQTIRYFSRETDLPLTIGLIVDTTPSESNMLDEERRASLAFLNSMLRPDKDKAFVIQFGNEVELLQDLTSSREKLEAALKLLERHDMQGMGSGGGLGRPGSGGQGGGLGPSSTMLADAIYLASEEIMKPQQGRKALLILADGDHVGDREEMAVTAAQRADTLVYAIRIYDKNRGGGSRWRGLGQIPGMGGPPMGGGGGMGGPGGGGPGGPGGGDGKKNLQTISSRTGGAYSEVSKKETLAEIYGRIEEELRSKYSLGYTPDPFVQNGYRKIKVAVSKKGLTVQGREGYYP